MTLGEYLSTYKITQTLFAEQIGVSGQMVNQYISGARRPGKKVLPRIAKVTAGLVQPEDFQYVVPKKKKRTTEQEQMLNETSLNETPDSHPICRAIKFLNFNRKRASANKEKGTFSLDGRCVAARMIIREANRLGAGIHYPGENPIPDKSGATMKAWR